MFVVESAGKTDVGRKRTGNEDSFFFDDRIGLYMVADGMGGHNAGEVASGLVIQYVRDLFLRLMEGMDADIIVGAEAGLSAPANWLNTCIHFANQRVHEQAQTNSEQKGMGSTVSAVLLSDETIIAANVGDSPIYLIRNHTVSTLSVPHTMMAEYEALAPGGSKNLSDRYRHMITRAMGIEAAVKPDISETKGCPEDILVICSDGLSDLVTPGEIMEIAAAQPPEDACNVLVNLANDRGGVDNITVIVLKIIDAAQACHSKIDGDGEKTTITTDDAGIKALEICVDTEDASFSAVIHDIDPNGAFIETHHPFASNAEVYLTVPDPQGARPFMVIGRVVKRRAKGIDVAFDNLTDENRAKIDALKRKIRG